MTNPLSAQALARLRVLQLLENATEDMSLLQSQFTKLQELSSRGADGYVFSEIELPTLPRRTISARHRKGRSFKVIGGTHVVDPATDTFQYSRLCVLSSAGELLSVDVPRRLPLKVDSENSVWSAPAGKELPEELELPKLPPFSTHLGAGLKPRSALIEDFAWADPKAANSALSTLLTTLGERITLAADRVRVKPQNKLSLA